MSKIFTPCDSNASTQDRSLRIQSFRPAIKACSTRVAPIVAMNGSDQWRFVMIHNFSSKDTRVSTSNKESLAIAGSLLRPLT